MTELETHLESNHASISSKYIKNIIFGGLDGIITTFSIVAAGFGANFSISSIIIMGMANLVADAMSMGIGEFLSSFFENKYILSERAKEEYEYENNFLYEKAEMIELLRNKGISNENSEEIVDIISRPEYKNYFLELMVQYELGLTIPEKGFFKTNAKEGLVTFTSFILFGFTPVLPYIICYSEDYDNKSRIFIIDCFVTIITMFILGYTQAFLTKQNKIKCGTIMCGNGSIAALFAFLIGYGLESALS
jgi:DNA damage-binding protein 1